MTTDTPPLNRPTPVTKPGFDVKKSGIIAASAQRLLARRRVLVDGAWVALGQVGAALGALTGIRVLTEFLPPRVFGEVSLLLGIATLGYGMAGGPFVQAALRFYPDCAREGTLPRLRAVTTSLLVLSGLLLATLWSIGWVIYYQSFDTGVLLGLLLIPLFALDMVRSLDVALFNAARRQRPMALWTAADAWARPLLGALCVVTIGVSAQAVLGGYIGGALAVMLLFWLTTQREGASTHDTASHKAQDLLRQNLLRYALPLLPLGLAAWSSSLADRYIIGGMLGIEQAGLYVAVYGIASRPAISLCGGIETTLRPLYFHAVSNNDTAAIRHTFIAWFGMVATIAAAIFLLFLLFSDVIAYWCLGERYRGGSALMPWIAAGYSLSAMSQVFSGIAYARYHTHHVLLAQLTGAIASVVLGIVGVYLFGIQGAAAAVTAALGLQLLAAAVLARKRAAS